MSKDPNDMDDLRPGDRAMLLALSRRQRDITPLSLDQERLLDSWTAGHLPPADAGRAAELTKRNTFAAERILEQRLISAANAGPDVPSNLTARVLTASRPAKTWTAGIFNLQWPKLSGWQWSGLGAAVAATAVIAVFGFQYWQAQFRPEQSFQIAMVTIEDQSVLYSGARRTRGISNTPQTADRAPPENGAKSGQNYFRDVDIPTALLGRAITSVSTGKGVVEHAELLHYLRSQGDVFDNRARILIESTLANRILGKQEERPLTRVRVYDLDDPHAAIIRSKIKGLQTDAHFVLLTLQR
jgi:hypothetical protein